MRPTVPSLIAAALLSCAGCANDARGPETPGARVFVELDPAPSLGAQRAPATARRFAFDEGTRAAWEARVRDGVVLEGAPAGILRVGGAGARKLVLPGPIDTARVNEIAALVAAPSSELMRLVLVSGDRREVVPPSMRIGEKVAPGSSGGPDQAWDGELRTFDLTPVARATWDEAWLLFSGEAEYADLRFIEFVERPACGFLPDAGEPARTIAVGRDSRPAVGIFSIAKRGARFHARPGAALAFAFGVPAAARIPGAELFLEVELSGPAGSTTSRLALRADADWTSAALPLDALGEGPAEASFALEASGTDEVAGLALTVPEVVLPGLDPPTVLLITSDTHRADYLGTARRGIEVSTPALDALADRGTWFADCTSESSVTNPSHVALFTGTHPRDTGVVDNVSPLAADAPTLAEAFAAGGWTTVAVTSASHLGPARSGLAQGFDRFAAPRTNEGESFDAIAYLRDWLPELEGRPLFAWVHVFDAHTPYTPPEPFGSRYYTGDPRAGELPLPERVPAWAKDVRDLAYIEALYRGEVSFLDERLRAVLEAPRFASGIVAMTADHGEHLGVRDGRFGHHVLQPVTLRVPLILAGPGVPRGARTERPASNIDLGRTLLDLAGVRDASFPGRNLIEALEPGAPDPDPRFGMSMHGDSASIEAGGWFLVLHLRDGSAFSGRAPVAPHAVQLFRVADDPECERDLASAEPERARRMRSGLVQFLASARGTGWNLSGLETSEEERAELDALGYGHGAKADSRNEWIDPDCECAECARWE